MRQNINENTLILKSIDSVISSIKNKGDIFGFTEGDTFIIFSLELFRVEFSINSISDLTIKTIIEISSNTSHYYYYGMHNELYNEIALLYNQITKLDSRFFNADIEGIGFKIKDHSNYLSEAINNILEKLPDAYNFNNTKDLSKNK